MTKIVVTAFSFVRNGWVNYAYEHTGSAIVATPFAPLHPTTIGPEKVPYGFAYTSEARAVACIHTGPSDHDKAFPPLPRKWDRFPKVHDSQLDVW